MSTKSPTPSSSDAAPSATELSQQAVEALLSLFGAMRARMRDALRDDQKGQDGLAPMHLRMLKHCLEHPGASQQALVQASGRDKGQIARLVKELDEKGLLVREADPDDGRSQRLRLTPAGRAACQRFRKHEAAIAQRLFEPMSARELQALIDQLGVLRGRLKAPEDDAPPGDD